MVWDLQGPAHFFLLEFLFYINVQEEKNESGAELKFYLFFSFWDDLFWLCLLGLFFLFFLVCRSQNKTKLCLVFSGCLQKVKMLVGSLSACNGFLCRGMLRNALHRFLLWLHRVRSFLEYTLDLGLLLLLCSLVLSEAFLAQTFYWCLPHRKVIMNSALLQAKSNSVNLSYLASEQCVKWSILTQSTSMTQHTNGPISKFALHCGFYYTEHFPLHSCISSCLSACLVLEGLVGFADLLQLSEADLNSTFSVFMCTCKRSGHRRERWL